MGICIAIGSGIISSIIGSFIYDKIKGLPFLFTLKNIFKNIKEPQNVNTHKIDTLSKKNNLKNFSDNILKEIYNYKDLTVKEVSIRNACLNNNFRFEIIISILNEYLDGIGTPTYAYKLNSIGVKYVIDLIENNKIWEKFQIQNGKVKAEKSIILLITHSVLYLERIYQGIISFLKSASKKLGILMKNAYGKYG